MAVGMTSAQIWSNLQSDPQFAINFIIDNNPAAVESNLTGQGVSLPANPSNAQIRGEIDALMEQIKEGVDNTDLISNDILAVPYIDTNPNYTGGMTNNASFMTAVNNERAINPNNKIQGSIWIGVISGITNAVGGIISGIQNKQIAQIQQQNLQMQLEADRDRFESGKVFGIPMMVVLAMIGFVAFVSYLAYRKGSK